MTVLALDGGKPAVGNKLRPFNTIAEEEISMVQATMRAGPLSGYLGGELHGGLRVEALEYEFAGAVGAKHAVAVNSATSGLLAACVACGVARGSEVRTTPFTMSATAAAPAVLGANIVFNDIEPKYYNMDGYVGLKTRAVIVANIFGHPAELTRWSEDIKAVRKSGGIQKCFLIEDNAQAPFAMEGNRYAGTVGAVGVFSLNVHKHLQCGEGGICCTNDDVLARRLRLFRNHSELGDTSVAGLNLRMTETTAAIALAQLSKREKIISGRVELAEEMTSMVQGIPGVSPPAVREGCKHVYYLWALDIDPAHRDWFVQAINAEGVPMRPGYVEPLYKLPAFTKFKGPGTYPQTEAANHRIALFEICAYDPSRSQMKAMREAFRKVGGALEQRLKVAA